MGLVSLLVYYKQAELLRSNQWVGEDAHKLCAVSMRVAQRRSAELPAVDSLCKIPLNIQKDIQLRMLHVTYCAVQQITEIGLR